MVENTYHWRVDVDEDSGLGAVVLARELDRRPGNGAAAARDLDLSATNIELRTALVRSDVQADLLRPDEVLSSR